MPDPAAMGLEAVGGLGGAWALREIVGYVMTQNKQRNANGGPAIVAKVDKLADVMASLVQNMATQTELMRLMHDEIREIRRGD